MKPDRSEIKQLQQRLKNNNAFADMRQLLTKMEQAAVPQEALTNDNNWNIYLQMLQSWVEATEAQIEIFERQLRSPELVNPDQTAMIKNYLLMCDERLAVLQSVMALPGQIIESGKEAKLELSRIGAEQEQTEET